jgi:exopolysaccharide biosynthesis polyprenyl glycosylphosphotransferase
VTTTNPQRAAILATLKLSDLGIVAVAFVLAVALASPEASWLSVLQMRIRVVNLLFVCIYLGYWHIVLHSFGLYRSYRLTPVSRELRDLGMAVLVGSAPLVIIGDLFHFAFVSSKFLVLFSGLAFVGLGIERRLFRTFARSMRMHGRNLRNVIIVGSGEVALDMVSRLARRADLGYHIVDVIEVDDHDGGAGNGSTNGANGNGAHAADAGFVEQLADLIARQPIDEVFVALPLDALQPIRSIVALCEEQGITVRMLSSLLELGLARAKVDELDGRPVITVFTGPPDSLSLLVKRLIDIAVSVVALAILAPAFVALAIAIRLDSRGPVFFVQERVGLNRRRFRAFKFRTMVEDAEQRQAELEPLNEAEGPVFKIRHDPRVTRLGHWIRRLSLDELPQLINVLRGEMSLVGPRPLPVRDVNLIDVTAHKRRFSVKPGITCLWQINGREPQFEHWIKADMEYIDNWSLALDFQILVKTIPAVLSGRGAY